MKRALRLILPVSGLVTAALFLPILQAALSPGPPFLPSSSQPATPVAPAASSRNALSNDSEHRAETLALYAQALRIEDEDSMESALPIYRQVLERDPAFLEIQLKVSSYLIQTSRVAEAIELLNNGLQASPRSPDLRSALAGAYLLNHEYARARSIAEHIQSETPTHLGAFQVLLSLNDREDKSDQNQALAQKLLSTDSKDSAFWTGAGRLYSQNLATKARLTSQEIAKLTLPFFEKAAAAKPVTAEACLGLSDCLMEIGKKDEALTRLRQAREINGESPLVLVKLGRAELLLGHKDEALDALREAHKLSPTFPQLREMLASAYLDKGQDIKAAELLEECLRDTPTKLSLYAELGKIYSRLNQLEKAELYLRQAVGLVPESPEFHVRLAVVQLQRSHVSDATETLAAGRKRFPESSLVAYYQALAARAHKDYTPALEFFQQARTLATHDGSGLVNADFWVDLAVTQDEAGEKDKVSASLEQALQANPDVYETWSHVIMASQRAKRLSEARDFLNRAKAKFPNNPRPFLTEAVMERQAKNFPGALDRIEEARKLAESHETAFLNADFYIELGSTLDLAKRGDEAEKAYEKGLSLDPSNANLLNSLAYSRATRNVKLDEAETLSHRSLELEPENPAFLDTLGWIWFKQGRVNDALTQIEKAAASLSEDPELNAHLAELYLHVGRKADALTLWRKVLTSDPDNVEARQKLDQLQQEAKNLNPAANPAP